MSLEFQSLQSIDNLANLIQTGGNQSKAPETGLKNWSADASGAGAGGLSSAARRLASASNLEAFMRSLSNNNMNGNGEADTGANNSNLQSLLQGMSNGNLVETGTTDDNEDRHYATYHDPYPKPCYIFGVVAAQKDCLGVSVSELALLTHGPRHPPGRSS